MKLVWRRIDCEMGELSIGREPPLVITMTDNDIDELRSTLDALRQAMIDGGAAVGRGEQVPQVRRAPVALGLPPVALTSAVVRGYAGSHPGAGRHARPDASRRDMAAVAGRRGVRAGRHPRG